MPENLFPRKTLSDLTRRIRLYTADHFQAVFT